MKRFTLALVAVLALAGSALAHPRAAIVTTFVTAPPPIIYQAPQAVVLPQPHQTPAAVVAPPPVAAIAAPPAYYIQPPTAFISAPVGYLSGSFGSYVPTTSITVETFRRGLFFRR